MKNDFEELVAIAEGVIHDTISALPEALRAAAGDVTLAYEDLPDAELIAEGFDPGTLGLFSGPDRAEHEAAHHPYPPQITIFIENLYLFAGYDLDTFREEVRVTYLHELGHYLGLNEDEIAERGLE
jgi:predicted Zn-dependent protease with MMP-like domain